MNVSSAASASSSASLKKKEEKKNPPPPLAIDNAFKTSSTGVKVYVEQYGRGEKLQEGDIVKVHYDGWLAKDYTKFDSSRDKRQVFEFELGKGSVIKGWDSSLQGIKVGSKLQLKIPAKEAYGSRGFPGAGVPKNADLIFKVEILDMERPEVPLDPDALRKKTIEEARLKRKKMESRRLSEMQIVKNGKVQELEEQPLTEIEKKMIERVNSNPNRGNVVKVPRWVNPKLQEKLDGGTKNFLSQKTLDNIENKSRKITSA